MSNFSEALAWAAAYCSRSEHCRADVFPKLEKYELSQGELEKLFAYLSREEFLNESRYAKAYALDQFRFHRWGRIKIRYALQQKHLSDECITEALCAISENQYQKVLCDLLKEKLRSYREGPKKISGSSSAREKKDEQNSYELTQRMFRFACGKGYEPENVKQCMAILKVSSI